MGYRGNNPFDDRDKEYERSMRELASQKGGARQSLDGLFKPKAEITCQDGHAWIQERDGVARCYRCKVEKPKA